VQGSGGALLTQAARLATVRGMGMLEGVLEESHMLPLNFRAMRESERTQKHDVLIVASASHHERVTDGLIIWHV
jgi:hypothetical protein